MFDWPIEKAAVLLQQLIKHFDGTQDNLLATTGVNIDFKRNQLTAPVCDVPN